MQPGSLGLKFAQSVDCETDGGIDLILTWRDIWKSWGDRAIKQEMTAGVQATVMSSDDTVSCQNGKRG